MFGKGQILPDNGQTIQFVVDNFLCTSCGVCEGVCPHGAVKMQISRYGIFTPIINRSACTQCALCVKTCPGHEFNYSDFYRDIHGELASHIALGAHREIYAGYTRDDEVLQKSQSGGFVSTLLLYCLQNKIIDGAVVTAWQKSSPFEPITYIARTREEVLAATGSKYNPVPAARIIRDLLNSPGKYAFVGTSCQIHGMRKAEKVFKKLSDRVALYIGLHCLGVFTYHFHERILHKIGVGRDEVATFRHRDKEWRGWPCDMKIVTKGGDTLHLDASNSRLWPRSFYTNWRCQLCFDKANEFSDISCGDCRSPAMHELLTENGFELKKGLSEFAARTERGQNLITRFIDGQEMVLYKGNANHLTRSIRVSGKKLGIDYFSKVAHFFGAGAPRYGVRFKIHRSGSPLARKITDFWSIVSSSRFFITFVMSKYRIFRKILLLVPDRTLGKTNKRMNKRVVWQSYRKEVKIERHIEQSPPAKKSKTNAENS